MGDLSRRATESLLSIVEVASQRVRKKVEAEPHPSGLGYQIDPAELSRLTGFARIIGILEEARANAKKSDDELNGRVEKELRRLLADAT